MENSTTKMDLFQPETNDTAFQNASSSSSSNVADVDFDSQSRIILLTVQIVIGAVGGFLVLGWLYSNRKSRVNQLIFHLVISDLLVIFFSCLMQLVWELHDRVWLAGDAMCKILKYLQCFPLLASTYMLIVLSLDRHQAIRAPLRKPYPVWSMTGIGWGLAAALALPTFELFHVNIPDEGRFANMTVCESKFRYRPISHRQAFLTYIAIINFFIPLIIIAVCYIRIFLKIAEKVSESKGSSSKKQSLKPGKVQLQSTPSSSLPKAKIKTLKMTIAILSAFIICTAPLNIIELIFSYGDHSLVPGIVYGIVGSMAVSNSAINPWIFLAFNANIICVRRVRKAILPCMKDTHDVRRCQDSMSGTRSEFTMNTEVTNAAACNTYTPDVMEMMSKKTPTVGFRTNKNVTYTSMTECD